MNIRFAQEADIEQIIELCAAHARYEKVAYQKPGKVALLFDYLFGHDEVLQCLVVVEGSEIVGYATFMKQFSTWSAEYYLYLDCLFLQEQVRGKGIGQQLMNEIKAIAVQKKCSWVEWQTPNFNEQAIRFYERMGAASKKKVRFYWE